MKQENNLGRAWDRFDVYLFDIDGTLIECTDATHYFAFCEALKTISGRALNLDGVVAHGNTDVGILRDALRLAGVREEEWRNRLPEVRASMGRFVEERKDELCTTVLPGVRKVLEHLQRGGAKLGVATGNLEQIGKLKLERAGLLEYFDFSAWSDNYEYRKDIFQSAVERARNLYGATASMCILGDTPADVQAAHTVGLPVIAIATGIFSRKQLMEGNPELCVSTLESLLQ